MRSTVFSEGVQAETPSISSSDTGSDYIKLERFRTRGQGPVASAMALVSYSAPHADPQSFPI
jgi:hypothetical protein